MSGATCDVLIVGAGPAGSATAIALRQRGLRVQLIDDARAPGQRMGESLPAVAQVPLRELGLWDELVQQQAHRPSYLMRSSWAGQVLQRSAIENPYGPDLHLERACFDQWLMHYARRAGADVLQASRLAHVEWLPAEQRWRATLAAGEQQRLHARYLVDATGRTAWLARKLGATRRHCDRIVGIARWFQQPNAEASVLVEASEHGWWYSAPLPHGQLVALFVADAKGPCAHAARREVWDSCLAAAPLTQARLRDAHADGEARTFAASPAITEVELGDPHWLAVGDAALAFDPLSADGLCFALRSALEAAQVLARALAGEPAALHAYWRGARTVFAQHLQQRRALYALEQRWPHSRFWTRRSATPQARHAELPP
jgi:flavin-dependent dehydrogenase